MKVALISDIHANLEALQSVLDHIDQQKIDTIHCLGDVVGYGADPSDCLDIVEKRCTIKLMGNHEFVSLGLLDNEQMNPVAKQSAEWTQEQLSDRELSIIADYDMEHNSGPYTLVHASPYDPDKWHYLLSIREAKNSFNHFEGKLCFFGHTHVPMIFLLNSDGTIRQRHDSDFKVAESVRYLVNIGSVGQPRDNDPRAAYTTFDDEENQIVLHRVEYDIEKSQKKMTEAELPQLLIDRLEVGR